ncbi:hypothetical protein EfsSVR2281_16010 [Enterococcus faecalis]|nr:hypothetical protein EfsSVR2281_16010 [Enterococcus faecalis]
MFFVIKRASDKKYYFLIKTEENEIIASSKTYYYKSSVLEIIESIKNDMNQKQSLLILLLTEDKLGLSFYFYLLI